MISVYPCKFCDESNGGLGSISDGKLGGIEGLEAGAVPVKENVDCTASGSVAVAEPLCELLDEAISREDAVKKENADGMGEDDDTVDKLAGIEIVLLVAFPDALEDALLEITLLCEEGVERDKDGSIEMLVGIELELPD